MFKRNCDGSPQKQRVLLSLHRVEMEKTTAWCKCQALQYKWTDRVASRRISVGPGEPFAINTIWYLIEIF